MAAGPDPITAAIITMPSYHCAALAVAALACLGVGTRGASAAAAEPVFDWVSSPVHSNESALFLGGSLSAVHTVRLCAVGGGSCVQADALNVTETGVKAVMPSLGAFVAFPCWSSGPAEGGSEGGREEEKKRRIPPLSLVSVLLFSPCTRARKL